VLVCVATCQALWRRRCGSRKANRPRLLRHDDDSEEEEVPSYGFAKALQTAQQAFLLPDSTQPEVEWVEQGAEQGAEEKEDSWAPSRVLQRAAGKAAAEEEAAEAAAEAAEAAAKAAAESQAACRHSSAQEREGGRAAAAAIIAAAAAPEPEDLLQGALQVPSRGAPTALDYWAKVKAPASPHTCAPPHFRTPHLRSPNTPHSALPHR